MECSIQCGSMRKLNSAAPVKAEGGKWLNVSIHMRQSPRGWVSGVLASSGAQLFPNQGRGELGRGCLWLPPCCLEQEWLSSTSLQGSSSLHDHQQDLDGPNVGPGCAACKRVGALCQGTRQWTEVQPREPGLMIPRYSTAVSMQASPFPRPPGCPPARPHICSAAVMILVFIPISSSMPDPGFWDSPCCASPRVLLLWQRVWGLLSCWGTPGADTGRDPPYPSEKLVQVKERASMC